MREAGVRQMRRSGLALALLALLAGPSLPARADVKVPAIFSSHMVLQRDQKDRVWGWAEPGEEVTVKIAEQSHTTKAGADGSWQVMVDPMPAGGPHVLSIQGKNKLQFDDVLVGEVWICSGQSNMQMVGGRVEGCGSRACDGQVSQYPVDQRAQFRHARAAEGFPGCVAGVPAGDGRRASRPWVTSSGGSCTWRWACRWASSTMPGVARRAKPGFAATCWLLIPSLP